MSPEVLSALIQAGTALAIAIGSFYLGRHIQFIDRNRQKVIETGVTATALVNPDELGPISISVEKAFITGKKSEKGRLPVKSAYNFVIGVSNVGLDDLEKPEIDIIADNEASIVEVTVKSEKIAQDKIQIQLNPKRPNFRRVIPQYMNRRDSLTISVLSINNTSPSCHINVGGKGIVHRIRTSSAENDQSGGVKWEPLLIYIVGLVLLIWLNTR